MIILYVLIGILLGGLVNYFADILPRDRKIVRPYCISCGAPRPALAFLSWVALFTGNDHCAYCGSRRGARALLVEFITVTGSIVLYLKDPNWLVLGPALLIVAIYVLIAVIDIENRLILHIVTGPTALAIGLLGSLRLLNPECGWQRTLLGGVVGFGIVYVLYLLGIVFARVMERARGQAIDEVAFGFGDVTLSGVIGLTVGWPGVIVAVVLGILAAGLFSLGYLLTMAARSKYNPFMPIPYGPFLILGAMIVYFILGA
jgi:prepilin signal peptidase PulO-like enzyme (type II secretory pathway)